MADDQPADPDPELTAILAEDAELDRQEREFHRLDDRTQLAVMLEMEDPDEAEHLFAEFLAAETDEECYRVLDEIFPGSIRKPS